jgi:colicin import membrane protein
MSAVFEILDAAPVIESALTASISKVQGEVAAFDKIAAGIAAIEAAHPKTLALDVATTAGMKQAIAGRAAYREPRIAVEKARKAAKAPVLELGKQIDAFAVNLEATLREGEDNYDSQIKAEEARKEAEKAAKAKAEAQRVAMHMDGIQDIRSHLNGTVGASSDAIALSLKEVEQYECGPAWEEFQGQATAARDETIDKLREMHAAAVAHEAEQARIKAEQEAEAARIAEERAELARLRAESEAREREAAAARAEQERKDREARAAAEREQAAALAAERSAQAEELRKQREAQEAELKAQREAQAKADAEAAAVRRAEEARLAAERQEIERQRAEAEALRVAEEKARAAAEAKAKTAALNMLKALKKIAKVSTQDEVKAIANAAIAEAS